MRVGDASPAVRFGEDEKAAWRERFPSLSAFYLAAVGSAVGFGNVWRFPALVKDFGGGTFFIPYIMGLLLIGLPILILEISLGQYYQTSNVGAFGSLHRRFRGVGLSGVTCAFVLVSYYSMLLTWVTHAFFASFDDATIWKQEGTTGDEAISYFYNDIIGMGTLGEDGRPTRLVGANVGYAAVVWLSIFFCLGFGMKWLGHLVYFTMGVPLVLLFVFLGKAISLEGSEDGIIAYIGVWDMSVLTGSPEIWSTAVAQIFFSLGLCLGTMTVYGSYCPRGEAAVHNSIVIAVSNCMFSFISGFAVFAALGHLAYLQGEDVDDLDYSGFSLVFGTWPVVFATFPGGEHWVRLLFFDLFLLGVDSAFSILDASISVMLDSKYGQHLKRWQLVSICCLVGYLFSLIYATDAGLNFLDVIDFYINFVLLLVGLAEAFAAGWVFGLEYQVDRFGAAVVSSYMCANFGSIIIACGFWFGLDNGNAVWVGFLALFISYSIGIFVTYLLLKRRMADEPPDHDWTWSAIIYELTFHNVLTLREELAKVVGYVPAVWAIGMKQLIPHVLLVLFINLALSENSDGTTILGNYGGYVTWPFQILGILTLAFALMIILVGTVLPQTLEGFDRTTDGPIQPITMKAYSPVPTTSAEENDVDH